MLGVLVVVAVAAGAFALGSGDEGETASGNGEVVLEPIDAVQEDDFAGNHDVRSLSGELAQAISAGPDFGTQTVSSLSGATASGTDPGLYGGTQDQAVCDVEQLVSFLTDDANAAKAEAFAGVLGIETGDIESYVGELTAVRLRFDTRVTNHGFRDGRANPFQSLLQAGTAVLVDESGVPRVKCNCGNPLLEPADQPGDAGTVDEVAQNPGDAWDGLEVDGVVSVQPGEATDQFTLVDNEDGALYGRPIGSNGEEDAVVEDFEGLCDTFAESPTCGGDIELGTGEVQITLEWDSTADLDLHVTEPDGTELYYGNSGPSPSGGELDVDSNVGCDPDGSVENVFWPDGESPPAGEYTIEVTGYSVGTDDCGDGDYTLTVQAEGEQDMVHEGTVADEETDSYPFTVG